MTQTAWQLELGANLGTNGASFKVWAPRVKQMNLELIQESGMRIHPMVQDSHGYYEVSVPDAQEGDRYLFHLDGDRKRPDPASRFQPEGVHGPSQIIDPNAFHWKDADWKGIAHGQLILYELHVGTFTAEGTFLAAMSKIPHLKKIGINCVEIMPVAQFPGKRNWGYDGVGLYAVQNSYGGPFDLKQFINACHEQGIAVCMDVVYNHLGPEGNYLHDYGPYFTGKHHTPWGDAVNYDDRGSDHVRRFVIDNALYWIVEYHVDALRLDAVHGIYDDSPKHILADLAAHVKKEAKKLNREVSVIAESDLNDVKLVRSQKESGYGLDAHWSDDFHHAVHTLFTRERNGYYQDFHGLTDVAKVLDQGFVYNGCQSKFRHKKHGTDAKDLPPSTFVVCTQNHDQVGNRASGDRLSQHLSFQHQKVSAALLLLSPYVPLLFMGQEFGETAPFQYFIDHSDPELIEAVRKGRSHEFKEFKWQGEVPDPYDQKTFERSKIQWHLAEEGEHRFILKLYKDLIRLRQSWNLSEKISREQIRVYHKKSEKWLGIEYDLHSGEKVGLLFSFADQPLPLLLPFSSKSFSEIINTESKEYGGSLKEKNSRYNEELTIRPQSALAGRL